MPATLRFLILDSEPEQDREKKRANGQAPSAESFVQAIEKLGYDPSFNRVAPADKGESTVDGIGAFDAVILPGSPVHFYEETDEVRRIVEFMQAVFKAGVPSFGSCAGLQIATVAAGGKVGPKKARHEAGFARLIVQTAQGLKHPLLAGRPPSFDAPAVLPDEVLELPEGATLLASSKETRVQAAEIRFDRCIFWGVQYHPEISLHEVANALLNEEEELIASGFVEGDADLRSHVAKLNALHESSSRLDLAWQLGLDEEVANPWRRTSEIRNFIDMVLRTPRI